LRVSVTRRAREEKAPSARTDLRHEHVAAERLAEVVPTANPLDANLVPAKMLPR